MIRIGFSDADKGVIVDKYVQDHGITKVIVLSPERFAPKWAPNKVVAAEKIGEPGWFVAYPEHIEYRFYYQIIRTIDPSTLVVINECARGGVRHALEHNCIRTFVQQSRHQIVFQYLPMVTNPDDTMTLVDWDTRSRWAKTKEPTTEILADLDIEDSWADLNVAPIYVKVDDVTRAQYAKEKKRLIDMCRGDPSKDPHQIPRNLVTLSGKAKVAALGQTDRGVARNLRFKSANIETYDNVATPGIRILIDPPARFLTLSDYLTVAQTSAIRIMVADTKADRWYLERLLKWVGEVNHAASALCG